MSPRAARTHPWGALVDVRCQRGSDAFPMDADARDRLIRLQAFDFLAQQTQMHGEVLPWAILSKGFAVDGQRVPLIGPQGIFKPAVLPEIPISISTAPEIDGRPRPYNDGVDDSGFLVYRYRGKNPQHRDNVGLRLAMQRRVPLIYLFGVVKGEPGGQGWSTARRGGSTQVVCDDRDSQATSPGDIPPASVTGLPATMCDLSAQAHRTPRGRAHPSGRSSSGRAGRSQRPRLVRAAPHRV